MQGWAACWRRPLGRCPMPGLRARACRRLAGTHCSCASSPRRLSLTGSSRPGARASGSRQQRRRRSRGSRSRAWADCRPTPSSWRARSRCSAVTRACHEPRRSLAWTRVTRWRRSMRSSPRTSCQPGTRSIFATRSSAARSMTSSRPARAQRRTGARRHCSEPRARTSMRSRDISSAVSRLGRWR